MATKEKKDIHRVGELYRGLTGQKVGDRPEDVEGQQTRAAEGSTFQSDLDASREDELRAQQAATDKYRDDRHAKIDGRNKKSAKKAAKKSAKPKAKKAASSKKK